jgi:hypothetical protein
MFEIFQVVSRDDGAALTLRAHTRDYFLAELRGLNLMAHARVGTYMSHGLGELFTQMASDWRGWRGAKTWSSLEGELRMSAEADRTGHVSISVELREGAPAIWTVVLELLVEAGQLESLARDARAFEASVLSAV